MVGNQLKVLLQRVYNGGREPEKIAMSAGMRSALRLEMQGSAHYIHNTFPTEDMFYGIPVIVIKGLDCPWIQLKARKD